MTDLALGATVSRTLLGLSVLDINDHVTYYLAPQFLGAQVQWSRTQVTSPFIDGSVTVQRFRQQVSEQIAVEILADTQVDLKAAMDALVDAFLQDSFTLTVTIGAATYSYLCEAADYQVAWSGPRFIAQHAQLVFTVPRQPVALAGTV